MRKDTVSRLDLTDAIYREIGLPRIEAAVIIESILEHMVEALLNGETVKLTGFGSFVVREKRKRIGRNPKTGKEVSIAKRRVLTFKPSGLFKQRVNKALIKK